MIEEHRFNVEAAKELGVNQAIILGYVKFWCDRSAMKGVHYHDGMYWTYETSRSIAKTYPYMSVSTVKRCLKALEAGGYIRTGNYNRLSYDKTTWYAITAKGIEMLNRETEEPTSMPPEDLDQNGPGLVQNEPTLVQNGPSMAQNGPTIPVSNPVNNPIEDPAINTYGEQPKASKQDAKKARIESEIDEILSYLNERAGTTYRTDRNDNRKNIRARLKEGYTVDDCKAVIDKKASQWLMTKYATNLNPATLFSKGKFDIYLNQPASNQTTRGGDESRNAQYVSYAN